MTIEDACKIRDEAIEAGLEDCCDECADAIKVLEKLGRTNAFTLIPNVPNPTYPQGKRIPTLGIGTENAARHLRRKLRSAA